MSLLKNRPKCSPARFFVTINTFIATYVPMYIELVLNFRLSRLITTSKRLLLLSWLCHQSAFHVLKKWLVIYLDRRTMQKVGHVFFLFFAH
jgi:hypothetical protein